MYKIHPSLKIASIEKMEKVMFELIIFGFILLTLSEINGAPFVIINM